MKNYYFFTIILLSSLGFAQIQTPEISLVGNPICAPGICTTYEVNYTPAKSTTSYEVNAIPFAPSFPYIGGIQLPVDRDDIWTDAISLPFSFCFYGETYNSIYVGANGLLTFDISPFANNYCPWNFNTEIPSPDFPVKNAIYGVYQDIDITWHLDPDSNVNYYVAGEAPNRVFVVNYHMISSYQCSAEIQTSQIVLHEGTNEIEVFIARRSPCLTWTNSNGLIGIQNAQGTNAVVPPGRNTGTWTTNNEAWKFTPNGESLTSINWSFNGVSLNQTDSILEFCPTEPGQLSATVNYNLCQEPYTTITTLQFDFNPTFSEQPADLFVCSDSPSAIFNLNSNDSVILGANNPSDFEIFYFTTLTDAQNQANPINNTNAFSGMDGQTIYASLININTSCQDITSFTLNIDNPPSAPIGATVQYFTEGQTLADLNVTGIAIAWFADEEATQPLPETTVLVEGTTYYALETYVAPSCQSENSRDSLLLNNMIAITVHSVLSVSENATFNLKVHPNPTSSHLNITANEIITNYRIYSVQGQLLLSKDNSATTGNIDISELSSGIYLLEVATQTKTQLVKILKK